MGVSGIGLAVQVGVGVGGGEEVGVDVHVDVGAGVELGKGVSLGVGETVGVDVAVAEGAFATSIGRVATARVAGGVDVGIASGIWQPLRSSRPIVVSRAMCLVHIDLSLPFAMVRPVQITALVRSFQGYRRAFVPLPRVVWSSPPPSRRRRIEHG